MRINPKYRMARNQRIGVFLFLILIIGIEIIIHSPKLYVEQQEEYITKYNPNSDSSTDVFQSYHTKSLESFNPNQLKFEEWIELGFSDKQTKTILNFKKAIGGKFSSKKELKKCFAISEQKFEELNPYILLPESAKKDNLDKNKSFQNYTYNHKQNFNYKTFNPNNYTLNDWINIGFTSKQAQTILNYKEKILKGKFTTKKQLLNCYAISEKKYKEILPFISLNNQNNIEVKKATYTLKPFDPNTFSQKNWIEIGFTAKQAQTILNYKNKVLKGEFTFSEQLEKCYAIDTKKYKEIKPFLVFKTNLSDTSKNKTHRYTLTNFNPNDYTLNDWMKIGFSKRQTQTILKYKNKVLKGKFTTKEQLKKCYAISNEKYEEIKPFIQFQ